MPAVVVQPATPMVVAGCLTADQCADIRRICGPLMSTNRRSGGADIAPVRTEWETAPTSPDALPLRVMVQALTFAASVFDLGPFGVHLVQALRYRAGHFHPRHADGNLDHRRPWVGAVIYLSRPDVDYTGGEFDADGLPPSSIEQGSAVLIPGHLPHRVRPVTSGERWVLTGFAAGGEL